MKPDCAAVLPVLGLPTRIEADDRALLDAALAGYAVWRGVTPSQGPAVVRLRVGWFFGDFDPGQGASAPSIVVEGSRLITRGTGMAGAADATTGVAECRVVASLAADPDRLAAELLDTLLLFLLTRRGRQPLHAAGLARNGAAAVLAAPSGVGKSTLALAAPRHGFRLLSDDAVYLDDGPALRVWGFPRAVHLAPATVAPAGRARPAPWAPAGSAGVSAAAGAPPLRFRNGRWKEAHPLAGAWATPPVTERGMLVLLERGTGRAAARRIDADVAVAEVLGRLDPGFDVFRATLARPLRRLAAGGAFRLTTSPDPDETLDLVGRLSEGSGETAAAD